MTTTPPDGKEDTDGYPCTAPDCDRVFGTQAGKNCHFGHVHKDLSRVEIECDLCGDTAIITRSRYEGHEKHYCSIDCSNEKIRKTVVCDNCGAELVRRPKRVNDRNFCDFGCHTEFQRGENHPNATLEHVPCNYCGEENPIPEWKRDRFPNHYCDGDCYAAFLRESGCMLGENNPSWVDGKSTYGEGWHEEKKAAVRERDGYECQGCDLTQEAHKEMYGRALSVHHITPARMFDDPVRRNAMDNLVALCMACHRRWEAMSPLRPVVE